MHLSAYLVDAGQTLSLQFHDAAGDPTGPEVTTGFVDLGEGYYGIETVPPADAVEARFAGTGGSESTAAREFGIDAKVRAAETHAWLDSILEDDPENVGEVRLTEAALANVPAGGSIPPELAADVALIRNATDDFGPARIRLTLPALPVGATSFLIQRSLDGASWTTIQSGLTSGAIFTDNGLARATPHRYRLGTVGPGGTTYGAPITLTTAA